MNSATGEQFELKVSSGSQTARAIVTERSAGLRLLEVNDLPLIETFSEQVVPPMGAGMIMAPWPGRIRDGRWKLGEVEQQLDLTEPARGNAIHGLLRNSPYRVVERTENSVALTTNIFPQHGYPFLLQIWVKYQLLLTGIAVSIGAKNNSEQVAPFAIGGHPYLRVGNTPVEDLTIELAATTRFLTDEQLIPTGEEPVVGTRFDLRGGVAVNGLTLDTTFGGVEFKLEEGKSAMHRLVAPDGSYTALIQDSNHKFVQVFTPKDFPRPTASDPNAKGLAIAVEPVTAPPNAFNSGIGLSWIAPGELWEGNWGITHGRK